jgi:hypothetical protein
MTLPFSFAYRDHTISSGHGLPRFERWIDIVERAFCCENYLPSVKPVTLVTLGTKYLNRPFGASWPTNAQTIQLGIEYDPALPCGAGHPDRAPGPAKATLFGRYEKIRDLSRARLGATVGAF